MKCESAAQCQDSQEGLPPVPLLQGSRRGNGMGDRHGTLHARGEAPRDRTAHEMTGGQSLGRHAKKIMPHRRGKCPESYRAKALLQSQFADVTFAELNSRISSSWRNGQLKMVTRSWVLREFTILRAVIRAARPDSGMPLVEDPMKCVRKPKDNKPQERVIAPNEDPAASAPPFFGHVIEPANLSRRHGFRCPTVGLRLIAASSATNRHESARRIGLRTGNEIRCFR